ncbi:MAG: Sulfate adenylyltransferase, dissimilatory-type [uncultured Sulfurovum sp.]|uniref:Sulfate adenylyltransferase, dissimilatory-type n=1 Tax=uncultured Sulfurovum sp. TaxID=269237 RepID=A0A6S6SC80_9BACT|nr:MAG: Sulfate adenylyltransferase, dissimilatory-type [uncultured Sulfurovum sp.]
MASLKRNNQLHIDGEALSTLSLVQEGLISPVNKLMNEQEAIKVRETKMYQGVSFPFPFLLTPSGKKNEECLKSLKKGDVVELVHEKKIVGELTVDETFHISPNDRLKCIYGTDDPSHPGVKSTMKRLGSIAVTGNYHVNYPLITASKKMVQEKIEETGAKNVSALILAANPLNRAHERMIRQAMEQSDLVVIFLLKPFTNTGLRYDVRYDAILTFIESFLPANKVMVVPLENSYIFAGYNELILDALVAKNYGCHNLIIGKNHAGLGLFYDHDKLNSVFDATKDIAINVITVEQYVYCNKCRTLVSTKTCPHGQHHHVHYHSSSILKLINAGMMPPSVLMRKEVSANILSSLFPERFEHLQELYDALMPNDGLIEEHSEKDFYMKLMGLYQTTSLT